MSINNQQTKAKLPSCLIVGGGISGLIIATELKRHHIQTTILDKGRGIGGRLATRRIRHSAEIEGIFDYGAQHFIVTNPKFQAWVDEWIGQGIVEEWSRGFSTADGNSKNDNLIYYRGVESNRSLAKYLAQDLNIYTSTKIINLNWQDAQWIIEAENGTNFQGDILIMTPPVPQSLALLESSQISLNLELKERLKQVTYHKCIAVLALLEKPSQIPTPGGLVLDGKPLAWIASNHQKGISPQGYGITLHAGHEFSATHWETDNKEVTNQLFKAALPWLNSEVIEYQVHRWRYSQPSQLYGETYFFLQEPPLILAGDAFVAPNIEGAVLSGLGAAEYLLSTFSP